jgi:hypothetical protein
MIPQDVDDDILMLKQSSCHYITDCHIGGIRTFLIILFIAVIIAE